MPPEPLPVLLRVHDRVADLAVNVQLIQTRWRQRPHPLFIVTNGARAGHPIPAETAAAANVIEVAGNPGHRSGASQLLTHGIRAVPGHYEFLVTLEADTWVLADRVVEKYLTLMKADPGMVWAAANWVDKFHSAAIDFTIFRLPFIREHLDLLVFGDGDSIESRLYRDIQRLGGRTLEMCEAYPIHKPKAAPWCPQVQGGRRRAFPRVPMVTHHIEGLHGGIEEKKRIANRTAGEQIFPDVMHAAGLKLWRMLYRTAETGLLMTPKSRWFKGRRMKDEGEE